VLLNQIAHQLDRLLGIGECLLQAGILGLDIDHNFNVVLLRLHFMLDVKGDSGPSCIFLREHHCQHECE
jgi:hypothetical protein